MVQLIGAGFPRTGTTSMKAALERLGLGPCYHMYELFSHPEHLARWEHAVHDDPVDWDRVTEGYASGVDWPFSYFWRDLAAAYPQAKVLLTVRDPHRWYASLAATIVRQAEMITGLDEGAPPALRRLSGVLAPIWKDVFDANGAPDEKRAVEVFEAHTAAVTEAVPAERLLVYEIGQGWEPLCAFLGVAVPDTPFPHLNDTEAMHRVMADFEAGRTPASPFETSG
ncbi:sulfotransferase family protein [Streptomonospora nanhaiensis]|uniref:sulfotransferase family protein n=1 Tax=Streptomonospora nanhaiensis TaxID=1323731 RepID=UPI001C991F96|nr:sulfotransferase family protein [Streptomonospora nanhaiensis]MBX9387503.1 sulfotransferase family protein [Streptomonospora nanhaiensis]